jgi:hypothetical protein
VHPMIHVGYYGILDRDAPTSRHSPSRRRCFDPARDVPIPQWNTYWKSDGHLQRDKVSLAARRCMESSATCSSWLAFLHQRANATPHDFFFRGATTPGRHCSKGIRPWVQSFCANKENNCGGGSLATGSALFGLFRAGWGCWSLRYYDAVEHMTIPVRVAGDIAEPFRREMPPEQYSVAVRTGNPANLPTDGGEQFRWMRGNASSWRAACGGSDLLLSDNACLEHPISHKLSGVARARVAFNWDPNVQNGGGALRILMRELMRASSVKMSRTPHSPTVAHPTLTVNESLVLRPGSTVSEAEAGLIAAAVASIEAGRAAVALAHPSGRPACVRWTINWWTGAMWEADYLPRQLLAKVQVGDTVSQKPLGDCMIVVQRHRQSSIDRAKFGGILSHARRRGDRFVVVSLGDENVGCTPALIDGWSAVAPLYIRNYWFPECARQPNVLVVPLGVKSGKFASMAARSRKLSYRNVSVFFASSHLPTSRRQMVPRFCKLPGSRIVMHAVPDYGSAMCDSKFALAPGGNVQDTWRLHEALDCGAIPVVTDGGEYFAKYMPRSVTDEFVVINRKVTDASIEAAISQMSRLLRDQVALDARGERLRRAYVEYREKWQQDVANRIHGIGEHY